MATTGRDLLDAARNEIPEISPEEVAALRDGGSQFALIDVREPDEFRAGYIPGAEHVKSSRSSPSATPRSLPTAPAACEASSPGRP